MKRRDVIAGVINVHLIVRDQAFQLVCKDTVPVVKNGEYGLKVLSLVNHFRESLHCETTG